MLKVRNLDVFYGRLQAVRGVSLDVGDGQIVALLGANGAGKTSVIRALMGLVETHPGAIELNGRLLKRMRPERRVGLGMAMVPEGRELFPSLNVTENLRMGGYRRASGGEMWRDLAWVFELFPALYERRRAPASILSGGQAQMLAIGRALMANPKLLLLDEPSHGLAPTLVDEVFALVPRLQQERGLSILLVEQNAGKALSVASYGYVLEVGVLELEGLTSQLRQSPRVRQLYLGG